MKRIMVILFISIIGSVGAQTMKYYSIGEHYVPNDSLNEFSKQEGTLGGLSGEFRATLDMNGKCYSIAFTSYTDSYLKVERFLIAVEKNYEIDFDSDSLIRKDEGFGMSLVKKDGQNYFMSVVDDQQNNLVVFFTITHLDLLEKSLSDLQEAANDDF